VTATATAAAMAGSRDSDIIMDAPDDRTDDRDPFAY
jgi:hypothetical protein